LKKRSSDGVLVCPPSTQKEAEAGKRQYKEKSRK
jgi:hypothetical protein